MAYLFLAECLLLCLIWAIRVSDGDFFAPAPLFITVFVFVSVLDVIGLSTWNTIVLSPLLFFIVLSGCVSFILGSSFYRSVNKSTKISDDTRKNAIKKLCDYNIPMWRLVLVFLFILLAIFIKIREVQRIGGSDDLAKAIAMSRYRTSAVFSGSGQETQQFSTLVSQCDKAITVIAFIMAFALVTCIFSKKSLSYFFLCFICFIATCLYSILNGGRANALGFFVTLVFAWRIIELREKKNNVRASVKLASKAVVLLALVFPLFYISISLVGRQADGNFMSYISFYFGGGLPSFGSKLENSGSLSLADPLYPYINSFYEFYRILQKFNLVGALPAYGTDWVYLGSYASNIYTCFYRYYADFGFLGNMVLCFFAGFLYTAIYRLAINSISLWTILLWMNVARTLIDVGRDETLFGHQLTSLPFWTTALYMIVFCWMLFGSLGIRPLVDYSSEIMRKNVA